MRDRADKHWKATIRATAALTLCAWASVSHAVPERCFSEAAQRYGLNANLLKAVASAESDMRASAVNASHQQRTGSRDIGLMQINTAWLPRLAQYGIAEAHLFDPCVNIGVGAWILAGEFARRGLTWDAVGAYNAACTALKGQACTQARSRYAWRVYRRLAPGAATQAGQTTASGALAGSPLAPRDPGSARSAGLISVAAVVAAQPAVAAVAVAAQPGLEGATP